MARCLVVQHVEPESAWAAGDALARADVEQRVCRVFAGDRVPADATAYDGVVVMGGPMSAASDEGFASRGAELALIADALASSVPLLGVCLGAQLVALAAGGTVYRGADGPEVGWAPVELSGACEGDPLLAGLPQRLTVLHWHGDTYDLPPGARHLAATARYAQQAFRVGDAAWGLQFHLEVTAPAVEGFLRAFAADAADAPGGPAALRRATPSALHALVPWRDLVLDRFAARVAGRREEAGPDGSRHRFANISDS